jgi:hypothetical protein
MAAAGVANNTTGAAKNPAPGEAPGPPSSSQQAAAQCSIDREDAGQGTLPGQEGNEEEGGEGVTAGAQESEMINMGGAGPVPSRKRRSSGPVGGLNFASRLAQLDTPQGQGQQEEGSQEAEAGRAAKRQRKSSGPGGSAAPSPGWAPDAAGKFSPPVGTTVRS